MKDFYVRDCHQHESQTITSNFVVASKQVKTKKNGELYLAVTLADRSGQLQANMWDNVADALNAFEQDDFVKVKGMVQKYSGRWQITIHKVRKLGDSEIDYADYLPKTSKDIDELWRALQGFVETFQDPWLKRLVQDFMADEAIAAAYKAAPAAKTLHHAYVGGLLDHVVSLFTVCDLAARNYPSVNRDLLLTGAFFHDIGKIHELQYQRSISYTTKGQLLGHMIIELEMLQEKLDGIPGFPGELKILVEHMIISHHGHYEFGSPKLPMFPEALMLHYLDDLDSKMESMRAQFERENETESAWTGYNPSLERPLLNTVKFLEKRDPAAAQTAAGKAEDKAAAIVSAAEVPPEEHEAENAAVTVGAANSSASPLDALQRKFASHKVTPAGAKD